MLSSLDVPVVINSSSDTLKAKLYSERRIDEFQKREFCYGDYLDTRLRTSQGINTHNSTYNYNPWNDYVSHDSVKVGGCTWCQNHDKYKRTAPKSTPDIPVTTSWSNSDS